MTEQPRLRYGSVCSGIEAATMAWHGLGWTPSFFSEIDKFPRAVLAHHYPDVPLHGDFTTIKAGQYDPIDLLVGGTPCQSFSIAGLRGGLGDDRGNLSLEYLRLAGRLRSRWLVWENVPGALSSNGGRDFGAILGGMVELGYGFAYRILDAQHVRTQSFPWAVPQRRRRLFVVGYLGDWRRAAAVLFDAESLRRDPPPRRQPGQSVAATLAASLGGCSGKDAADGRVITSHDPAVTLTARERKGPLPEADLSTVVAHTLRGEGHDAREDGTGRGTPLVTAFNSREDPEVTGQRTGPLGASSPQAQAIAIQERAVSENPNNGPGGAGFSLSGSSYTLEARTTTQAVAFDTTNITSPENGSNPQPGDPCFTLNAGAHPPALAFDMRGREGGAMPEGPDETANIRAASGGSSRSYVAHTWAVRRLTPRECERLQGFPDDFTLIPWRGKPADQCPDGPRYKALGNSMAVNVMQWIGERIAQIEALSMEQTDG